jgi:Domain of unknown function (DUF4189)
MAKVSAGMLAAVLAVLPLPGAAGSAWADGALAVGSTGDVVRDGIAFGMVIDEPKATAAAEALKRCRTFKARAAAERCSVVATFSGECFAVAYDPKPGTPGAGWGIGPDQAVANGKAISMCEDTAGPERKGYCRVESAGCDTAGPVGAKTKTTTEEHQPTEWSDVRERFRGPSGPGWDIPLPVLLLLGVAGAGVVYILSRTLKGRAGPAAGAPAKAKTPAARPAKGKAKRT